jgi:hypothetical protein
MPRFLHFSSDLNHTSFILQGDNISGISQGIHRMKNSFGATIINITVVLKMKNNRESLENLNKLSARSIY